MSQPVVAAQLYTVRQFAKTAPELATSLKKVSEIGYTAVQVSGIGPIPDADVKKMTDDLGLKIVITHIPQDKLWNDIDAVIEQHKLWDCKNVAIGSMPNEYRVDEAGYHRFAKEASQVGEKLAAAGLTFSYHNHSFEFVRFGERTGLDIIYQESDPRYLMAEIDTYWVQHGGSDPAAWIRRMKNRMPVVHFKDMVIQMEPTGAKQIMAEIGEGNLNWPAIIAACQEAGVQWYAVEQDVCQRDPFESLKISYQNLKAMGLS
jgi:sugar phosphate isomerase/epimerase